MNFGFIHVALPPLCDCEKELSRLLPTERQQWAALIPVTSFACESCVLLRGFLPPSLPPDPPMCAQHHSLALLAGPWTHAMTHAFDLNRSPFTGNNASNNVTMSQCQICHSLLANTAVLDEGRRAPISPRFTVRHQGSNRPDSESRDAACWTEGLNVHAATAGCIHDSTPERQLAVYMQAVVRPPCSTP